MKIKGRWIKGGVNGKKRGGRKFKWRRMGEEGVRGRKEKEGRKEKQSKERKQLCIELESF